MDTDRAAAARIIIEDTVRNMAREHAGRTAYLEPLFGYARADDPAWKELRERHVPGHLLPSDILPGARSVACLFLPFEREVVAANARAEVCADEWATAYVETNNLLASMCSEIQARLEPAGVRASWELPTHNFDPVLLRAKWSHKSVAVIAGIGAIGLHQMLITRSGCAGRVSSITVDVDLTSDLGRLAAQRGEALCSAADLSSEGHRARYCGFFAGKRCTVCMRRCPVSAISENGIDKAACYRHLNEVMAYFAGKGWPAGEADVCGKCVTGPCALAPYRRATGRRAEAGRD
ncbi:MAG: epoxyqueuosine reductase [Bacillota bacterium]